MEHRSPPVAPESPASSGTMQALLLATDWAGTPLGPYATWPGCLRTAVSIVLHARQPMAVAWGPSFIMLYNDSYRTLLGARGEQPAATFGQPIMTLWPELRDEALPILERALAGQAEFAEDLPFRVTRNGDPEQMYVSISTSPISADDGVALGVFCTFCDSTATVVARREREATLADHARYRTFFTQGAHAAILMSCAGVVLEVNQAALDSCGFARTDIVGKPLWDCPWWRGSAAAIRAAHAGVATAAAGRAVDHKLAYFTATGSELVGQMSIAPVLDETGRAIYLAGTGVDVTEREGIEARLRLLDAIGETTRVAAAPEAIMEGATRMLGEYLQVTRVAYADLEADNDRFTIRHDWTAPGAFSTVGVYSLDLFGPRATASMRGGETLRIADVDREVTVAEHAAMFDRIGVKAIICCPLVKGGKLVAMMAVHQDVPRAWSDAEVALVEAVVERCWAHIERVRAMEELRATDRRKSEFLAVLAHELRNPLAPIRNGIDMLRISTNNPAAAAKVRDMMERQVTHMVHLINDLLDVARVNNGKVVLQPALVELRQMLVNALESSAAALEAARHVITLDIGAPDDDPIVFDADPVRLAQVLSNLLSNAIKYTPPGGRLQLSGQMKGDMVEIRLQDNGIGIPAEHLASVFDMFTQVSRNLECARGGLGIGLSLVQRLVELHGGTVAASSAGLGQGSTFVVRLPAPQSGHVKATPAGTATVGMAVEDNSPLRILVADDNVDAADTMCALLEASGYVTRIAYDGAEALALGATFLPHVALLDLGMPRLDGFETAQRMRAMPVLRGTVLVAVTGWGAESDRERSRAAGFDHHLLKPASMQQVQEILAAVEGARYAAYGG